MERKILIVLLVFLNVMSTIVIAQECPGCWESKVLGTQLQMPPGMYTFEKGQSVCQSKYGAEWDIASFQEMWAARDDGMRDERSNTAFGKRVAASSWFWVHKLDNNMFCVRAHLSSGTADIGKSHSHYPVVCIAH